MDARFSSKISGRVFAEAVRRLSALRDHPAEGRRLGRPVQRPNLSSGTADAIEPKVLYIKDLQ